MSSLKIQKAETHALYKCTAANKVGEDSRIIFFHVTRELLLFFVPFRLVLSSRPLFQ